MAATDFSQRRQWVLSVLEEYEGPLTRFAQRLLGDEDAARDAVQHAFLRLCDRSPESLAGRVAPWLFAVCRNKAVDVLRTRGRTMSLDAAEETEHHSREADPADTAERQEIYGRLYGLIGALPPDQREAIVLWSERFSYREIAEITGHSEGNVRVLVHRGLSRLRRDSIAQQLVGCRRGA